MKPSEPAVDFDYQAVERAMGESCDHDTPSAEATRLTACMLRTLTDWVMEPCKNGKLSQVRIARRFIAAMWIMRPDAFGGVSLCALARRLRIGRDLLEEQTGEFARRFRVHSHAQDHAWNRKH